MHTRAAHYPQRLGLPLDSRGDEVLEYAAGVDGLTPAQLVALVDRALTKYDAKRIHPGKCNFLGDSLFTD
jgi:hypothetical protein